MMTILKRESELADYLIKQPYLTELNGVQLEIGKNVFPSDFGLTSSFVGRFILQQKPGARALDMACGSGYFAFLLKKMGCDYVLGADLNLVAIQCAQGNCRRNPDISDIEFVHSDLFSNIPPMKFDLIMFNFNYYPGNGNFGLNQEGGRQILRRFFSQASAYCHEQTRIYMPYSLFVGEEHDPKTIAGSFGFFVETVATTFNQNGEHVIYQLMRA
jgi:predicted RNA methylase